MYVNKVVAVTGKVVRVMKNQQEQQVVFLQSGGSGGSVSCTMKEITELPMVLLVGIGHSTYQKTYDSFLKIRLLRQSSGAHNMPVTVSFVTVN